jgi:hypothetical protein
MPVGVELSDARRKLELSIDEVSTKTKVKIERLNAIELMDVDGLPTLVYLRGFLRAYAAAVQLDPDEVTKRYLAELPPSYAAREASPPPVPGTVGDLPLKTTGAEPSLEIDDVPGLEMLPAAWQPAADHRSGRAWARSTEVFEVPEISRQLVALLSRGAALASRLSMARSAPTPLVAVIALLVGWVLGASFDDITRRSTRASVVALEGSDAQDETFHSFDAAQDNAVDAPQDTPEKAIGVPDARSATAPEPAAAFAADGSRANPTSGRTSSAVATDRRRSVEAKDGRTSTHNVSGSWSLTNRLDPADSGARKDLNLGFHLQLQQRGNRVSGTAQKWMENGRSLPASRRTPITVEGTLTGRRLELSFTERATQRAGAGTFVMTVADDGTLRGRFVSDAAKARGTSLARRMESPRR